MKIAVVSPSYGYGGSNIVTANLGKELLQHHEVFFFPYKFTTNFSDIPEERFQYIGADHSGLRKIWDKFGKGSEFFIKKEFTPGKYYKKEIENLLEQIEARQIELVILSSFESSVLFAEALKLTKPELKIISWMHEAVDYSFGELTKNYPTAFQKGLALSDAIVCLTHQDQAKYLEINKHSTVIYNPVVLEYNRRSRLEERVISFTTRLNIEVKGLDYLVEAAQILPEDWKVRVAGHGRPDQVESFQALLRERDLGQRIDFVGPLQGVDLANHYFNSSIFLSTSRTEGLPLVLIEALFFGLPIISFDHSGGKEILGDGQFGKLVKVGDVSGLQQTLLAMIQQPEERVFWQKQSVKRAQDFETEKIVQQWLQLLAEI